MTLDGKKAGYVLLRLALGAIFVCYAYNKFRAGVGATVDQMGRQFERTILPALAVKGFAGALPFLELVVGLLLLAGLFTRVALVVAGLELIVLSVGLAILGNTATVAANLLFLLVLYVLLAHEEDNALSLDAARKVP